MYKQRVETQTTLLKRKWKLRLARSRMQRASPAPSAASPSERFCKWPPYMNKGALRMSKQVSTRTARLSAGPNLPLFHPARNRYVCRSGRPCAGALRWRLSGLEFLDPSYSGKVRVGECIVAVGRYSPHSSRAVVSSPRTHCSALTAHVC